MENYYKKILEIYLQNSKKYCIFAVENRNTSESRKNQ